MDLEITPLRKVQHLALPCDSSKHTLFPRAKMSQLTFTICSSPNPAGCFSCALG